MSTDDHTAPTMESDTPDPNVEYRDIEGCPGYKVGSDGSVWRCKWDRLKGDPGHNGHLRVAMSVDGKKVRKPIHHLVLEAFVGPRPDGQLGCHFPDRDPSNNRVENLRWDTQKGNLADREAHGTLLNGEKHPNARLTDDQIAEIRRKYTGRRDQSRLAREYGVHYSTIWRVVHRLGRFAQKSSVIEEDPSAPD